MAPSDSRRIHVDGQPIVAPKRKVTGTQLRELVEPHAENIWLDLDDAQDHPIGAAEILLLEDGTRFFTDRPRSIFIDKVEYEVRSAIITEDQLRLVPRPPVPASHGIWRDIVDEIDDPIQDGQIVRIAHGDRFFTKPLKYREIPITVNRQPVVLQGVRHTGQQIKDAAIAQNVAIGPDFLLSRKTGRKYKPVGDEEHIRVQGDDEFRAVDGDDNS